MCEGSDPNESHMSNKLEKKSGSRDQTMSA